MKKFSSISSRKIVNNYEETKCRTLNNVYKQKIVAFGKKYNRTNAKAKMQ